MNSLEIIERKNAEAIANNIPQLRAAGKWVLSTWSGLHFIGCQAFANEADARRELAAQKAKDFITERYELLAPTGNAGAEHLGEIKPVEAVVGTSLETSEAEAEPVAA